MDIGNLEVKRLVIAFDADSDIAGVADCSYRFIGTIDVNDTDIFSGTSYTFSNSELILFCSNRNWAVDIMLST